MAEQAGSGVLEWKGRTGPFELEVDPTVFAPTHTSRTLADALEIEPGDVVIDVGCGSGVLSFVAARLGAARLGVDLSPQAVEIAHGGTPKLGLQDRVEFRVGNLLEPVRELRANVIIGDVSGIPDEIAAVSGWFPDGRAGGRRAPSSPRRCSRASGRDDSLVPGGKLFLPTGTLQAEGRILEVARRIFGAANLQSLLQRELPLPDVVAKSKAVGQMMKEGILDLHARGSRLLWRLQIWRCEMPTDAVSPLL